MKVESKPRNFPIVDSIFRLGIMPSKNFIIVLIFILMLLIPLGSRFSFLRGDLYEVTAVLDGDTIEVNMAGRFETVRLIGLDTPETNHPDIGRQCYGEQATKNLQMLISHRVQLIADPKSTNRDKYDRLLRYVYTEKGVFLNLEQVKNGFGFASRSFNHSLKILFIASEAAATGKQLGLWSACRIIFQNGYPQTQEL